LKSEKNNDKNFIPPNLEHFIIVINEDTKNRVCIDNYCYDHEYLKEFLDEIMLKVIENKDKFEGKNIRYFKRYIHKSLKNKISNHIKKDKIKQRFTNLITNILYSSDEDAEDEFISQYMSIISVLDKLSLDEHKLLDMHYSDGMTLKEIAVYLNETESAIKQRHKRLKAKIRLLLNVPPPANIMPIKYEKNNVTFFLEIVLYIIAGTKLKKVLCSLAQ
jgi:RNA polymerase sigma factor (sigma-70 family)